jgi:ribonuclease VapC
VSSVLDASAIIAVIDGESGADVVAEALDEGAVASAVNISEVVARLADRGFSPADIESALARAHCDVMAFDEALAFEAGLLRPLTRHAGLSLGDRACLALARQLGLPVLTADRNWQNVSIGVEIRLIR